MPGSLLRLDPIARLLITTTAMVTLRRKWAFLLPALTLVATACGDGGNDSTTDGTSTSTATDTGTSPDLTTTTGDETLNPTTGPLETSSGTSTTGETTVDEPGTSTAAVSETTPGTDSSTTLVATDTGDSTTSEEPGPADIPEIPDDGMPSSAHFKPVPLGTSDAKQGYWEYLPPGYGGGEKYPLLVFLHGIGENGNGDSELNKVPANGPPKLIKQDQWPKGLPFVVLSPQHPGGGCPGPAEVHDFLQFAMDHYDVNLARVYLTGLSCGAIGSWDYIGEYLDEQIVAMVPIAGNGNGAFMKKQCELGKVPLWAFHGDADPTVAASGTIDPITKLQMCDPKPEADMVIYPGVGHDSWTQTYNGSAGHDIYAWLLEHYKP